MKNKKQYLKPSDRAKPIYMWMKLVPGANREYFSVWSFDEFKTEKQAIKHGTMARKLGYELHMVFKNETGWHTFSIIGAF